MQFRSEEREARRKDPLSAKHGFLAEFILSAAKDQNDNFGMLLGELKDRSGVVMAHKTVCVLSGGMDSTCLLHHLLHEGDEVLAISFDYGQRHVKELEYAAKSCKKLGVDHRVVDLTGMGHYLAGSALTSLEIEVPEGHYRDETMKATVVPNRNMIMMAIAGALAISQGCDRLAIAVHAGDHHIYPDCRPEFVEVLEKALKAGNYAQISVYAPFLNWTKTEIAVRGRALGIDFDADTWSCYVGAEEPCGKCGTCVERIEALTEADSSLRSG